MLKKILFVACFLYTYVLWGEVKPVKIEYWLDDDLGGLCTVEVSGELAQFTIDGSTLSEGVHTLRYRAVVSDTLYSPLQTWSFFRIKSVKQGATHVEYWIDESEHNSALISYGNASFSIDASAYATGLHTLHYQVKTDDDVRSPEQTWLFYKIEQRDKRIVWYRIWWNNHQENSITVKTENAGAGFLYEETIAVPDYARNDGYSRNNTACFHIQFGDDRGCVSYEETADISYTDIYPPVTSLTASPSEKGESVSLSWTTNEDNVRDYNVYYSENNQPYMLWLPNITRTNAVFRGKEGSTYRFLVTARDDKGNNEAMEESKAVKVEL